MSSSKEQETRGNKEFGMFTDKLAFTTKFREF